jgi:hypothetical protein
MAGEFKGTILEDGNKLLNPEEEERKRLREHSFRKLNVYLFICNLFNDTFSVTQTLYRRMKE